MDPESLKSAVEAILFAADKPVPMARFREVFGEEGPTDAEISDQLGLLKERYLQSGYGFELREAQGGFHFCTKPENGEWVRRFLQTKPFRVGRSALETLAIIAYRQPVTRAEIDQVRGIDSSHLLRVLMERGLVMMTGKAEIPGRPVQYATTQKFLETVGLTSLGELPPLTELEQIHGDTEDPIKALETGLDRFMEASPGMDGDTTGTETEGLDDIDTMIQTADRGGKDVYESPEAQMVAAENEEAVKAWQEFSKKKRRPPGKKTVRFEELTGAASPEAPAEVSPVEAAFAAEAQELTQAVEAEALPEAAPEERASDLPDPTQSN